MMMCRVEDRVTEVEKQCSWTDDDVGEMDGDSGHIRFECRG
jgi:hypothetical protein